MTGATMTGPKRDDARRTSQRALFFKQVFLHRVPARAAKFFGPAVTQPAFFAQNFGPALHVVTGQMQRVKDLV